jgi:hypothetical protein
MNQSHIITKTPRPFLRLLYIFGATSVRCRKSPSLWDISGILAQIFLGNPRAAAAVFERNEDFSSLDLGLP